MRPPRVVLFDLGNVLVQLHPERFWTSLGRPAETRPLLHNEEMREIGRNYESGAMTTEEFWVELARHAGGEHSRQAVERAFCNVLPEPIAGMEEIVRTITGKADTALVSNTSPVHFAHCLRTIPALQHLQRFYISYQLRALKPDAAFYRAVIDGEQREPEEMVFIDDLPENVEGARLAGMLGIIFEGAEQLKRSLGELGL